MRGEFSFVLDYQHHDHHRQRLAPQEFASRARHQNCAHSPQEYPPDAQCAERLRPSGAMTRIAGDEQRPRRRPVAGAIRLELHRSHTHYKTILASRTVPILFILVCFLIIANTRCDHVSSTNVVEESSLQTSSSSSTSTTTSNAAEDKQAGPSTGSIKDLDPEGIEQQAAAGASYKQHGKKLLNKMDPLHMLREIYLDHNSKVITLLTPDSDTVQKFHPNGRYGRRSVDNALEPHAELGQLVYDQTQAPTGNRYSPLSGGEQADLRAILRNYNRIELATRPSSRLEPRWSGSSISSELLATGRTGGDGADTLPESLTANGAPVANYKLEMNKLLSCNYTGISNLYRCNSAVSR